MLKFRIYDEQISTLANSRKDGANFPGELISPFPRFSQLLVKSGFGGGRGGKLGGVGRVLRP